MLSRLWLAVFLAITTLSIAGCASSQDLRDRAGELDTAANRIRQILESNPPDSIEQSELVAAIVDVLPPAWKGTSAEVLASVGDVRTGAEQIAAKLAETADKFEAQADKEASEGENALAMGLGFGDLLIGTNGLLATIGTLLWRKKRKADQASRDTAAILEDLVTSIESVAPLRDAIKNGAGDELRKSMSPATMAAVKAIKAKT